ncbi:fungal protein [Schizosaccharomyces japonicus yFS275]|uniref:Fungal protein n=1 Tax=Schizosaccharomyces japonicus (strain yFS275 / FY16936) TaxID=402676 RepID=B6K6T0_SCHJY|nr:fungal protein [Schizosaccharomyces japonicus yFS275]EEB09234.1 fungal protein [Schizosaccharomyces japonicus yFS275]
MLLFSAFLFFAGILLVKADAYFDKTSSSAPVATTIYSVVSGTEITSAVTTITASSTKTKTAPTTVFDCRSASYIASDVPICKPTDGVRWVKDKSYLIQWDPYYFGTENINLVLSYKNSTGLVAVEKKLNNYKGEITLKVNKDWLHDDDNQTITVDLETTGTNNVTLITGPTVNLASALTEEEKAAEDAALYGHKRNLKAAIIVPAIFLVIILAACIYHAHTKDTWRYWFYRLRRPRHGYGIRRSRRQRMAADEQWSTIPDEAYSTVHEDTDDYHNIASKKLYQS